MVWNHAVFSKNRERLLNEEIAEGFFRRVIERAKPFMSDEHFTVDGTLIEAWASYKSFRRKDGKGKPPETGGGVNFHGEKRKNETHEGVAGKTWRILQAQNVYYELWARNVYRAADGPDRCAAMAA